MNKETKQEIGTIILATIILSVATSFYNKTVFIPSLLSFLVVITSNIGIKKIIAHNFEIEISIKFWEMYRFGLRKKDHFKKPISTVWIPLLLSMVSRAHFLWLGILEYDAKPKPERASKRHGLYRFTQVTEKHLGVIAFFGLLTNLILGIAGYILGFELFAKLSIYFAMWSIIPVGKLDGTKILFSSRILWIITFTITSLIFLWSFMIV